MEGYAHTNQSYRTDGCAHTVSKPNPLHTFARSWIAMISLHWLSLWYPLMSTKIVRFDSLYFLIVIRAVGERERGGEGGEREIDRQSSERARR